MLKPSLAGLSHEDLFVQRYQMLLGWSRKLTRHNQQMAEDLLHDVFVQFTLARPDLGAIQNVDGYLYRMLRNRHLSGIRRTARAPLDQLSSVEYDSAETRLRSTDPRDQLKVLDELRAICSYACARKQTSRAGSILILRFFLGYYPAEIVQLSRSSRQAVDSWLRIARTEARTYLEDPSRLAFLNQSAGPVSIEYGPTGNGDFLLHLRSAIFSSNDRQCPSGPLLQEIYTVAVDLDSAALSHIVSCAACLDTANNILGLPPLRDRYPTDTISRDKGPRDGPGPAGASGNHLKQCRRKSRDVFEHSPTKLSIAVNGFTVGTQTINSEISEFTLNVNVDERIGFVEVYSEQDLLLLTMDVEPPPDGPPEQCARMHLSDDRSLDLAMNFAASWPALTVTYRDPALKAAVATPTAGADPAGRDAPIITASVSPEIALPADKEPGTRWTAGLRRLLGLIPNGFWSRPGTITAALALILIAALFFLRVPVPGVSAAALLDKASEAERLASGPDNAIHRTLILEKRDLARNLLVSHRKIETWTSAAPISGQTSARRVYDEQGRVLAGEFVDEHGSSKVYRHAAGVLAPETIDSGAELTGREIWRIEPSAAGFASLIADVRRAGVSEDSKAYYISFDNDRGLGPQELVRAALTLAKPGLHVTQESIQLRLSGALFEYKFIEDAFEQVKPARVPPGVFNLDPLLSQPERFLPAPGSGSGPAPSPSPRPAESVAASADLEVEVEYLLDRVKANLGEQVTATRTPDDRLLVKGIVDTESRKSKILEALSSVAHDPAVKIDIATVDEITRRQKQPGSATVVQRLDIAAGSTVPVFADLRRHFIGMGVGEDHLDEQIRRFSTRVLQQSAEAQRNAWALKRLADQLSRSADRALSTEARSKQLTMIKEHALACLSAYDGLRRDLQPIFPLVDRSGESPSVAKMNDETDLARTLRLFVAQAVAVDAAVRSAFTITSGVSESAQGAAPRFWKPLTDAEALASSVARFARERANGSLVPPGE